MKAIHTEHNLDFEACPWDIDPSVMLFKVGTVSGQWYSSDFTYTIISIINHEPGNGHLTDVLEWFEYSCKRDKKVLLVREFFNDEFYRHCVEKRGFVPVPNTKDLMKTFL